MAKEHKPAARLHRSAPFVPASGDFRLLLHRPHRLLVPDGLGAGSRPGPRRSPGAEVHRPGQLSWAVHGAYRRAISPGPGEHHLLHPVLHRRLPRARASPGHPAGPQAAGGERLPDGVPFPVLPFLRRDGHHLAVAAAAPGRSRIGCPPSSGCPRESSPGSPRASRSGVSTGAGFPSSSASPSR